MDSMETIFKQHAKTENLGELGEYYEVYILDKKVNDNHGTLTNSMWNLYNKKVKYVGDNSAVIRLLAELNLREKFGPYSIKLNTSSIPYGLRIIFEEKIDSPSKQIRLNKNLMLIHNLIENVNYIEAVSDDVKNFKMKIEEDTEFLNYKLADLKIHSIDDLVYNLEMYDLSDEYIN